MPLEPLDILPGMGNPSFRGRLSLDHPLGLLFSQSHLTAKPKKTLDLALELRATLPQRADLRRSFERRTQRTQIVRGGFCPGDEGFEAAVISRPLESMAMTESSSRRRPFRKLTIGLLRGNARAIGRN